MCWYSFSFNWPKALWIALCQLISSLSFTTNIINIEWGGNKPCHLLSDLIISLFLPTGWHESISRTMYAIINGKIEKVSKYLNMIQIKIIIPISILPSVITTIVNYYIFDLGSDSFILPFPMLYVLFWKELINTVSLLNCCNSHDEKWKIKIHFNVSGYRPFGRHPLVTWFFYLKFL